MKEKHIQHVNHQENLEDRIRGQFPTFPSSGATVAYPCGYPDFLNKANIELRDKQGLLGTTLTNPDGSSLKIGVSFQTSQGDKEDIVEIQKDSFKIYHRGTFEEHDSRYRNTHHGNKSYLKA